MVPSAWVELDALPLTPSGKVDRQGLPEPEWEERGEYEAPRDDVESALAEVWSEVLRAERVGVHDNFFELGGDSILSIQVVARAAERGLRLTSKQLFQQQTIAELGRVVETAVAGGPGESGEGRVPLTPIQRWHFAAFERPGWFSQSMLLRVSERVSADVLGRALAALVATHEQLRARFWRDGEQWVQEVLPASAAPVPVLEEAEAMTAALQGERDLERDPMLRAALLRTPAGEDDLLLLDVHHLGVDGVSWRGRVGGLGAGRGPLHDRRAPRAAAARPPLHHWRHV